MTYLDKFIAALRLHIELDPKSAEGAPDLDTIREAILSYQSQHEFCIEMEADLRDAGRVYVEIARRRGVSISRSCHGICDGFLEFWSAHSQVQSVPLSITIGDVFYKGRPMYNATRASVAQLLKQGKRFGEELPVHVWITLQNMTVVDLTIASYLREKGETIREVVPDDKGVLVWREGEQSDFSFEPILVHNRFFDLVDSDLVSCITAGDHRSLPTPKPGRNDPCPCGSSLKYKKCCGRN